MELQSRVLIEFCILTKRVIFALKRIIILNKFNRKMLNQYYVHNIYRDLLLK